MGLSEVCPTVPPPVTTSVPRAVCLMFDIEVVSVSWSNTDWLAAAGDVGILYGDGGDVQEAIFGVFSNAFFEMQPEPWEKYARYALSKARASEGNIHYFCAHHAIDAVTKASKKKNKKRKRKSKKKKKKETTKEVGIWHDDTEKLL